MKNRIIEAGSKGPDVRSDAWMKLEIRSGGGVEIDLTSKVQTLYGRSIEALLSQILDFFGIKDARLEVVDSGAVPWVLAARLEAAVRRLEADDGKRYLPDRLYDIPDSSPTRFRRSRLYLPGNTPKFALNAAIHRPDGLILDLEDSVAVSAKDEARILVRNALRSIDFMGAERMVRINQLPMGIDDLKEIIPQKVDCILIPKVETADQIKTIDSVVDEIQHAAGDDWPVYFMPIIESGLGVINAYSIGAASRRNVALAIGLEDYTADIGAERTDKGTESFYARSAVINAARASGLQAIDTVYSDVSNMDGLRDSVLEARSLGFDGKGCIHPRQIRVIHEAFLPPEAVIEKARRIVLAFEDAEKKGLGVVSLGSKMIDPPVVKRAVRTISLAERSGVLAPDWRENHE